MTSMQLLQSLGDLIRSARSGAGLTQRQLGSRAGIGGKYISEIERGTRDVPISTLCAIAERGFQLHLDIAFRGRGRATGRDSLPTNVEEVAALLAELPMDVRTKVVGLVRNIIELAR